MKEGQVTVPGPETREALFGSEMFVKCETVPLKKAKGLIKKGTDLPIVMEVQCIGLNVPQIESLQLKKCANMKLEPN